MEEEEIDINWKEFDENVEEHRKHIAKLAPFLEDLPMDSGEWYVLKMTLYKINSQHTIIDGISLVKSETE